MNQLFDMSSDEVITDFVDHVPRKRRRYQEKKNHLDYWQGMIKNFIIGFDSQNRNLEKIQEAIKS
jgi:hypothetical protein